MADGVTPAWLAPHVAAGERVAWARGPGGAGWRGAAFAVAMAAFMTFYVGFSGPEWWTLLPVWPERAVSPLLGALLAAAGFLAEAARTVVKHRYTAYAVTDARLLRVVTLGGGRRDAWPLSQVRIVERETDGRRSRTRVEVRSPAGKRVARFRVTGDGFAEALLAAGVPLTRA